MASNKLTEEQRADVVKRLARHHTLLSIVRDLKKKFGITISPAGVAHYDPERTPDADIAQRWKDLFWKTRRAYLARTADVGLTDKPARIRRREAMMHREWAAGRHKLANAILDSIARDIGDAFGSRRKA